MTNQNHEDLEYKEFKSHTMKAAKFFGVACLLFMAFAVVVTLVIR